MSFVFVGVFFSSFCCVCSILVSKSVFVGIIVTSCACVYVGVLFIFSASHAGHFISPQAVLMHSCTPADSFFVTPLCPTLFPLLPITQHVSVHSVNSCRCHREPFVFMLACVSPLSPSPTHGHTHTHTRFHRMTCCPPVTTSSSCGCPTPRGRRRIGNWSCRSGTPRSPCWWARRSRLRGGPATDAWWCPRLRL